MIKIINKITSLIVDFLIDLNNSIGNLDTNRVSKKNIKSFSKLRKTSFQIVYRMLFIYMYTRYTNYLKLKIIAKGKYISNIKRYFFHKLIKMNYNVLTPKFKFKFTKEDIKYIFQIINLNNIRRSISSEFRETL